MPMDPATTLPGGSGTPAVNATTRWERVVVPPGSPLTRSPANLVDDRILHSHGVNYTALRPGANDTVLLALARVAGYDVAVDGLPATGVHPLLVQTAYGDGLPLLVAATGPS